MKRLFVLLIWFVMTNTVSAGGGCPCPSTRGGEAIATYSYRDIGWIYNMILSPARDKILFLTARGLFLSSISDLSVSPQILIMDSSISVMTYHPDGSYIALGDIFGNISVIYARTGDIIQTIKPDNQLVYALAYSTDGDTLAIGDGGGVIRLWHIPTNTITTIEEAHDYYVAELIYHPQENRLISTGGDSQMKLWDVSTDTPELLFEIFSPPETTHLIMNPDGSRLIASSDRWSGMLLDSTNPNMIESLEAQFENTYADFSADGDWLVLCVADEIQLWTVNPLQLYAVVGSVSNGSQIGHVDFALFLPDSEYVLSLSGNTVSLWDITQAEIIPPAD